MPLSLILNGHAREFAGLAHASTLADLVAHLALKGDRVAVEHNGDLVQRARWAEIALASGDRLEVVHFVGGGTEDSRKVPVPVLLGFPLYIIFVIRHKHSAERQAGEPTLDVRAAKGTHALW